MPRHLLLVIVGAACLAVGLTVGLLLRPVSADWFEAVGTWVGVVVSTAAVVLAVQVFRSEDFMRRMGAARETQREEAVQLTAHQAEEALAQAIDCSLTWGAGNVQENGHVDALYLAIEVRNNTDGNTVTAVSAYYPPVWSDNWHELANSLRAGDSSRQGMLMPSEVPMPLPEGNASLVGKAEFRYTMGGIRWTRRNGEPAVRR